MAGSFSNYLAKSLLDHVFGGVDFSHPATLYVGLFTVTPGETGGGTEVTGGSYTRLAVTNNATNFPAASLADPSVKTNGTTFTFVTAFSSWGTINGCGIFDASTSGNLLAWSDLTAPKTIDSGDTASFNAGSMSISLD